MPKVILKLEKVKDRSRFQRVLYWTKDPFSLNFSWYMVIFTPMSYLTKTLTPLLNVILFMKQGM